MAAGDGWLQIPDQVLQMGKMAQDAEDWAMQQRQKIANLWAAQQRQYLNLVHGQWQDQVAQVTQPAGTPDTQGLSEEYATPTDTTQSQQPSLLEQAGQDISNAAQSAYNNVIQPAVKEMQRPAELVRLGIGGGGSPGEKLAAYYERTDPSLPVNVRIGRALDLANADYQKQMARNEQAVSQYDPTKGVATGAMQTVTNLATDPTMLYGGGASEVMAGGAALGGIAGGGLSLAEGQTPAQTAQNVEAGANLGMLAGGGMEAAAHALPKASELASHAAQRVAPVAKEFLKSESGDLNLGGKASKEESNLGEGLVVISHTPDFYRQFVRQQYPGAINATIVKEAVQNSVDASRGVRGATTVVDTNPIYHYITVKDQGTGMTPEILQEQFAKLGGSAKSEGASGGMGTAKAAIMGNAEDFALRTVAKDPKTGRYVESILAGNSDQYLSTGMRRYSAIYGQMPAREISNLPPPLRQPWGEIDGKPQTGTWIYVKPLADAPWSDAEEERFVQSFKADNKLQDQKVIFKQSGKEVPTKSAEEVKINQPWYLQRYVPATEHLTDIDTPTATLKIYGSKEVHETSSAHTVLMNAGQPQVTKNYYLGNSAKIPMKLAVDVVPKVSAKDVGYPWVPNRTALIDTVDRAIDDYISGPLRTDALMKETGKVRSAIEKGVNILPHPDYAAPKTPIKVIDPTGNLPDSVKAAVAQREYVRKFGSVLSNVHAQLELYLGGSNLSEGAWNMRPSEFLGIGTSKDWLGLNVGASSSIGLNKNQILIDPWKIYQEIRGLYGVPTQANKLVFANSYASRMIGTMLHEMAHNAARGHDENFSGALTRVLDRAGFQTAADLTSKVREAVLSSLSTPEKMNMLEKDANSLAVITGKEGTEDVLGKYSDSLRQQSANTDRAGNVGGSNASVPTGSGERLFESNGEGGVESPGGVQSSSELGIESRREGLQSPDLAGVRSPLADLGRRFLTEEEGTISIPSPRGTPRATSNDPLIQRTIDMLHEEPSRPVSLDSFLRRASDAFTRAWTSRGIDLKRWEQEYQKTVGRPLNADEMAFARRLFNPAPAAQLNIQKNLIPAIRSVGDDKDFLDSYLIHQHNVEIARAQGTEASREFSGGFSAADSAQVLQNLQAELGPERFQRVQQAAQQVVDFGKSLLQKEVDHGIITQDNATYLEAKFPTYVPIKILDYLDEAPKGVVTGRALSLRDTGIKSLSEEGTTKSQMSPTAALVDRAYQVESMALRNDTFNAIATMRDGSPELQNILREVGKDYKAKNTEGVVQGFRDGVVTRYVMPKELADMLQSSSTSPIPEATKVMGVVRAVLASNNPLFITTHAAITALPYVVRTTTREGSVLALPKVITTLADEYLNIAKDIASGRAFQGRYSANAERYLEAGGGMFGSTYSGTSKAPAKLEELLRPNAVTIRSADDVRRIITKILTGQPVADLINRVDLAPRVAAFRLAEQRGANAVQSVYEGRSASIDFAEGGNWAKVLNQIIPFFNAGIQGTSVPVRAFRDNPLTFLGTAVATLVVPTLATEAWNRMDPQRAKDYADVPDYYKDTGLVIMHPGFASMDAQGNRRPNFSYIPARAFSPFIMATREAVNKAMGTDDPRSWFELVADGLNATAPIFDPSRMAIGGPIGNIAIGALTGKNLTTGGSIESKRADLNAGTIAKGIAGGINAVAPAIQSAVGGNRINARPSDVQFGINEAGAARLAGAIGQPTGQASVVPTVRNAIGQQDVNAKNARIGPNVQKIMDETGITTVNPTSQTLGGMQLTREEHAQLQLKDNAALEQLATRLENTKGWQQLDKETKVKVWQKYESQMRKIVAERFVGDLVRQQGADKIKQRIVAGRKAA